MSVYNRVLYCSVCLPLCMDEISLPVKEWAYLGCKYLETDSETVKPQNTT